MPRTRPLYHQMRGGLDSDVSPETTRTHLLDIVGRVEHKCLELTWFYSDQLHEEATVRGLAEAMVQALDEVVVHCAQPGAGGRTPSDFPLACLDQAGVDRLVGDGRGVEDIYPLTPMQAGMVFHALSQGEQGLYLEQAGVRAGWGARCEACWRRRGRRWSTGRRCCAAVWSGTGSIEPLQVVHRDVEVPIGYLDWRGLPGGDRDREVARLLADDRAEGFDLAVAPLLRVNLAQLSGTEVQVVWTFHHVLLDGWSVFQVLSDVFACHAALAAHNIADTYLRATPPATLPGLPTVARRARIRRRPRSTGGARWPASSAGRRCPTTRYRPRRTPAARRSRGPLS